VGALFAPTTFPAVDHILSDAISDLAIDVGWARSVRPPFFAHPMHDRQQSGGCKERTHPTIHGVSDQTFVVAVWLDVSHSLNDPTALHAEQYQVGSCSRWPHFEQM